MGKISRALHLFIVLLMSIMLTAWVGPALETRFFPVYSRFDILTMEKNEAGVAVVFKYVKYRDCAPRGWAWYVGEFGAVSRQVEVKPVNGVPPSRAVGPNISSKHLIAAEPQQVRDDMYAEIYTRCHPFWLTRSVVRP